MKTLLVRIDRFGDIICTLPVDEVLDEKPTWLVSKSVSALMQSTAPVRHYHAVATHFSLIELWRLVQWLRQQKFQRSLVFHAPWWISLALFCARVPHRFGKKSQWHSYLFLNRGIRQSRKQSDRHEFQYNIELLQKSFDLKPTDVQNTFLKISTNDSKELPFKLKPNEYFVVHPGMGGSALNWPQPNYYDLIIELSQLSKVVITGTESDYPYVKDLQALSEKKNIVWAVGQLDLRRLLHVLSHAKSVLAPSTGVTHMAAATKTRTVSIYPPIQRQAPTRWGPRGPNATALTPNVNCPAESECLLEECRFYPCMETISVSKVKDQLLS